MKKLLVLIACVSVASIHGMFHNYDTGKYDMIAFHAKKFRNYSTPIYDYPNYDYPKLTETLHDQLKAQSGKQGTLDIIQEEGIEAEVENPTIPPLPNALIKVSGDAAQVDRPDLAESLERKLATIFAGKAGQNLTEIQEYVEHLTPNDRSMVLNILDKMISDELNKYHQSAKKYDNSNLIRAIRLAKLQRLLDSSSITPKDYSNKIINNKYYY
jgi:hypothetical protein